MKTRTFVLLLAAALVGGLAALPGSVARADEKAREGVWVFDVRIIRVDPATPQVAESLSLFEETEGATVPIAYPQIIETLKKRGTLQILLDQRITTLDGVKAHARSQVEHPLLMVASQNESTGDGPTTTQKRQSTVKTGCSFAVTPTTTTMTYAVEARWALPRYEVKEAAAPPQIDTQWEGTHPALVGDTLVLHYREQVDVGGGLTKAVELYALVTGSFIAK